MYIDYVLLLLYFLMFFYYVFLFYVFMSIYECTHMFLRYVKCFYYVFMSMYECTHVFAICQVSSVLFCLLPSSSLHSFSIKYRFKRVIIAGLFFCYTRWMWSFIISKMSFLMMHNRSSFSTSSCFL